MNMYQEKHMNKSHAVVSNHKEETLFPMCSLFSTLDYSATDIKDDDRVLASPTQLGKKESKNISNINTNATNADAMVTNNESDGNSWYYPSSPMDDIILNKRRSHYRH